MSLPTTGLFVAQLSSWKLSFDGDTWSSQDADFGQLVGPALARETPWHRRQHLTVDEVGPAILNRLFPGQWTEISVQVDAWQETLDPGAVD